MKPLVWVDLETTGTNFLSSKILQVACVVTNSQLEVMGKPFERVVQATPSQFWDMDFKVQQMHTRSGLWWRCLKSTKTIAQVDAELHEHLQGLMPERWGTIAGSNVSFDKMFMALQMPQSSEHLHYRILDVSSIHEAARRFTSLEGIPKKTYQHEAMSDIMESIEELKWYRQRFFK